MEIIHLNTLLDRAISSNIFSFPESIIELIDVIGVADTYKITKTYGGTRVYIPKTLPPAKCDLQISIEGISALQKGYGGESIEIPKSASIDRFIRNISILQLIDDGISARKIAIKYDLSVRQINNIRASHALYKVNFPPITNPDGGS